MLGVVEPTGNGIGGDLFAMVWDAKEEKLHGLNGSGRSPRNLTMEHLHEQGLKSMPSLGPLPVTVPGCVDSWFELHDKFGKLPMSEVLEPGFETELRRELARRGHSVGLGRSGFGGYQAVARTAEGWSGASESRKDGYARGF